MPSSWAASIISRASSRPRARRAGSLSVKEYGQYRKEQSPLIAMPISSAILRIARNWSEDDFGERSLSRS